MSEIVSFSQKSLFARLQAVRIPKSLSFDEQYNFANDPHPEIRYLLVSRPDTTEFILKTLKDNNKKIRDAINKHPIIKRILRKIQANEFSFDDQYELAHHWNPLVRITLAYSVHTPQEILEALVFDEEIKTRIALVLNINTPENTLMQLTKDTSQQVRINLARRRDISDNILKVLLEDSSPKVLRQLLLVHRNKLSKLLKSNHIGELVGLNNIQSDSLDVLFLQKIVQ
ncbi:MAG: hypothetical protein ACFFD1_06820 [Candidatus Thorarchaeota archaeon]